MNLPKRRDYGNVLLVTLQLLCEIPQSITCFVIHRQNCKYVANSTVPYSSGKVKDKGLKEM